MRYMDRYRGLSRTTRTIFWVILGGMILVGLIAFFTSETGRNLSLVCCGAIVLAIVIGALSERGMNRPR